MMTENFNEAVSDLDQMISEREELDDLLAEVNQVAETEVPNGLSAIKELIQELSETRKLYKDTSDTLNDLKEKKTQLEVALFLALENAGLQNVKGEDGTTFYRKEQLFASVKIQDKPRFFEWLRNHQMGDIIKEDVHPKTLTAFVKEQIEHGNELPDYVSTFTRDTIGYRGGK